MFGKKKKEKGAPVNIDYTNWEKDLGFLNLILSRKKGITREYLIKTYSRQKIEKDYITDEELEPIIEKTIGEVINEISGNYKLFLIEKYFGSENNLIKYITEDIYVDLVTDTINENIRKIKGNIQNKLLSTFSKTNKKKEE